MGNLCKKNKKREKISNNSDSSQKNLKILEKNNNFQNFQITLETNKVGPIINNFLNKKDKSEKIPNKIESKITTKNNDNNYETNKISINSNAININYKTFIKGKNYSELRKEYDILEHLGAGAFGIVQKVRHKVSKQIRAMKTVKKNTIYEERNLKEIENLSLLDHPNILKLYEYFYDSRNIYVITEYCQGGELFDKIKERNGYFTEKDAAKVLKPVLQAVAYCHSMKLVHRDLKPENILLEGNDLENIKVIDFGSSAIIKNNQKFREKIGSAYYIAPEVLKRNYDEKCDLWSIGVIMYILLTGQAPFNGPNEEEILKQVKSGCINFESKLLEETSVDAKDLLQKLLERNSYKRLSAIEALSHPWIKNQAPNFKMKNSVCQKVFENLKEFQADRKLQEAAISFIVNQLISKEETEDLRKIFIELDVNCDGLLSKEEIENGLKKYYNSEKAKEEAEIIFKKTDADKNGFISYDEFIRASIDKNKILTEEKLREAYKLFDKNGDGNIEAKEIKEVLGKDVNIGEDDPIWKSIIKEVDLSGKGTISYEDFKIMMEHIVTNEEIKKE